MTFEAELPKCTSFTTLALTSCDLRAGAAKVYLLVLKSCDFRARAAKVYFRYCTCTDKLRPSSRSCQSFLVLKSCDFRAGAAKVYFLYCTCSEKLRLASRSCIAGFPHVNADLAIHLYVGKLLSFTLTSRGTQKSHGQNTCRPLW